MKGRKSTRQKSFADLFLIPEFERRKFKWRLVKPSDVSLLEMELFVPLLWGAFKEVLKPPHKGGDYVFVTDRDHNLWFVEEDSSGYAVFWKWEEKEG